MHAIHDFTAKLRQPSLAPQFEAYLAWRRALQAARGRGEPDPEPPALAPVSINLDLTTACNFKCTHCVDWDMLNTKDKYQEQELKAGLRLMQERGLRSVILIGGGEPTLYPRFADFVRYLKELGLQVAIVSNGSRGKVLLEAVPPLDERDWIRLSLDAGSNELFVKMHRPADPKLDLDAICSWIPEIKRANPRVRIGFSYIITWNGASRDGNEILENVHEIEMAAERARRSGFDYIAYKPVLERQPDGAEVMDPERASADLAAMLVRIRGEIDKARAFADDTFEVYESINLRMLESGSWRSLTRQPRTCHMQALRQVVSPLGLYNCPAHRGVAKARIAEQNAYKDEATAQQTGQNLLKILDQFDASHECREVTCLYNGVNWWIEKLVANPDQSFESEIGEERLDWFL
jgi:wyosine [tRNA(Phe)-imidazoG37] synthetase (radical SAM superfamily)